MRDFIKVGLSAALIALGAVVILGLFTASSWLDPVLPAVIGTAVVLPISVVATMFLFADGFQARWRRVVAGAIATFVSAGVGLGIPVLWAQPQIRIALIERGTGVLGNDVLVNYEAALNDVDENVRLAACGVLLDEPGNVDSLARTFMVHPTLAVDCLNQNPDAPALASLAEELQRAWHKRLLMNPAPADEPQACSMSAALVELPRPAGEKQADLLDCALRAAEESTRTCCAQSLKQAGATCPALAEAVDSAALEQLDLLAHMGALAYGESRISRQYQSLIDELEMQCPEMRAAMVTAACGRTLEGADRSSTRDFIDWVFEESSDCLSEDEHRAIRQAPESVHELCANLLSRGEKTAEKDSAAVAAALDKTAICEVQRETLVELREREARFEALREQSRAENAGLADLLDAGGEALMDKDPTVEEWLKSARGEAGARAMDSYSDADMRRINALMKEQAAALPDIDTVFEQVKEGNRIALEVLESPKFRAQVKKELEDGVELPDLDEVKEMRRIIEQGGD